MALKATVFKCELNISDMDRHYYQTHALTIARHPSENDLRMMIRIIAFALNADDQLQFTKGLSSQDEPDLWNKSLSDEIDLWIDLGQVDEKRLRQACGKGKNVVIYTYNDKQAGPWETLMQSNFNRHNNLSVYHIPSAIGEKLGALVQKNMELQISIQDGELFINSDTDQVNFTPVKIFPV